MNDNRIPTRKTQNKIYGSQNKRKKDRQGFNGNLIFLILCIIALILLIFVLFDSCDADNNVNNTANSTVLSPVLCPKRFCSKCGYVRKTA